MPKKKINFKAIHETYSTYEILSYRFANMVNIRGVTTVTNAVSRQSQNFSGNLEISPGIGTHIGKHAIIPGHCRKNLRIYVGNSKNFREGNPKIREDDPNFRDDLR